MTDNTDDRALADLKPCPEQEFRKTATIRATQWFKMGDHPAVVQIGTAIGGTNPGHGWIDTLEGGHMVTPGDWIATGVKGEHWPIKPDIFAATYEPVSADRLEAFHAKPRSAFDLMQEFYLSPGYDPKAARPADTVQAAIAFTLAALSTPATTQGDVRALDALKEIQAHATMANNVIRLNRDGAGNGRVKVATCMHHIQRLADATLGTPHEGSAPTAEMKVMTVGGKVRDVVVDNLRSKPHEG